MTFPSTGLARRVACLGLLAVLCGCATLPPRVPGDLPAPEAGRALVDGWRTQSARHHSLQGIARVRVQTATRTVNGTQVLLAALPDRLRTETLSPFGNPLLILAANGPELAVLLPGDNLLYRGRANPDNLARFTRLPLRLGELIGMLLYRPPLIDYRAMTTYRLAAGGWRVELEAEPKRQELLFDAERRLIAVRYLFAGELQLQLAYGEFAPELDGMPQRIELQLPREQTGATLVFSEMATDRDFPAESFALIPPEGVTIVALDEAPGRDAEAGTSAPSPVTPEGKP